MTALIFLAMLLAPFLALVAVAAINKAGNTTSVPSSTTTTSGSGTNKSTVVTTVKQHPWWATAAVGTVMLLVLSGNLFSILTSKSLIALVLLGIGSTLIWQGIGGKDKKLFPPLLGGALIVFAAALAIMINQASTEAVKTAESWQACRENPQQARCTNKGAAPGTEAVKAANYVGSENGTYTVRDDQWSVFGWPDGQCMMFLGGTGLLDRLDDRRNTRSLLSPLGTQTIEVKYVPKGDSWKGVVCQ